jgi:hypothetical protein
LWQKRERLAQQAVLLSEQHSLNVNEFASSSTKLLQLAVVQFIATDS